MENKKSNLIQEEKNFGTFLGDMTKKSEFDSFKEVTNTSLINSAKKDGTLQTNLNSEKINNFTATGAPTTIEKKNIIGMVNELDASNRKKADKTQEPIFQATLQNGWIGSLMYFKDQFGIVHVFTKTNLIGGTLTRNTVIANLPIGYKPNTASIINAGVFYGSDAPTNSSGAGSVRIAYYDGNITLDSDVKNYIHLNFSFPTH